jgi:hypothetical protein
MAPIVEPLAASWSTWMMSTPGAFANGVMARRLLGIAGLGDQALLADQGRCPSLKAPRPCRRSASRPAPKSLRKSERRAGGKLRARCDLGRCGSGPLQARGVGTPRSRRIAAAYRSSDFGLWPAMFAARAIASSFYQALDTLPPTKWDLMNAKLLQARMATANNIYRDYGVALQPTPPRKAKLLPQQREIFEFYGYDTKAF